MPSLVPSHLAGLDDGERGYWPKFSAAEVARHHRVRDGWIIVHERVYDITTFAVTHPGFHNSGRADHAFHLVR